jgi:hypothetical protein
MKTMKSIFALMIAALVANVATASGNLKVSFASNDAKLTEVEISNTQMTTFEIEVMDEMGNSLYEMKATAPINEFNKKYDFTGLEDGTYWYSVKIDKEEVTKEFTVERGQVEIQDIRKSLEPHFAQDGKMVKLTFLNFQNDDVKLYVYDDKDNLLNQSDLGSEFSITKGINMDDLRAGTYDVVIATDYEVYDYEVSIE